VLTGAPLFALWHRKQSGAAMDEADAADAPADLTLPSTEKPVFEIQFSRGFEAWLGEQRVSIAFTTYQIGKIFFIGLKPDCRIWVFNRNIGRCTGIAVSGSELWVAGGSEILRFNNPMAGGIPLKDEPDALYVPQVNYFTGDLDAHDIGVDSDDRALFVNTRFNCIATVSTTHSFREVWRPPFISKLAAEDRCHLNGLALKNGQAKYVSAVARSDTYDGWRDHRDNGGVIVDVETNETICAGLSMPHSPRMLGDQLWVLNSGTGQLGQVDVNACRFEPLCFCPGYLRGLALVGSKYALVGLSKPRGNKTFAGLQLDTAMMQRGINPRCGIYVVDLKTGDVVHSLFIEGIVTELYDVAVLPGIRQPTMVGLDSEDQKRMISIA
jgi:uncharacterized protein (TIGR03032 family)